MKKLALILAVVFATAFSSKAQVIPSFAFGIKGGMNLTSLSKSGTFNSSNQAGYLGGVWARFGALGFNFQPEAYITSKNVSIYDTRAKFTSLDVPLLFGGKIGAFGFGARFYTGPLVSFAINKDQSYSDAAGDVTRLNFKDQNYAWQLGAGVDIRSLSIDLRYEAGLNKQGYNQQSAEGYNVGSTRVNLFNLTLAYKIF